jgi:hypothetical protein
MAKDGYSALREYLTFEELKTAGDKVMEQTKELCAEAHELIQDSLALHWMDTGNPKANG